MLPNTHKALGAELAAMRLHALTLASTEAVISLSVSGVRDEEKETRTGSQLRARAKGTNGRDTAEKGENKKRWRRYEFDVKRSKLRKDAGTEFGFREPTRGAEGGIHSRKSVGVKERGSLD